MPATTTLAPATTVWPGAAVARMARSYRSGRRWLGGAGVSLRSIPE
jgi:hypothetical protein